MPEHIIDDWNCYFYEFESTAKLVRMNAYRVILYALVCTHCSQYSGMQLNNNVCLYTMYIGKIYVNGVFDPRSTDVPKKAAQTKYIPELHETHRVFQLGMCIWMKCLAT